MKIAFVWIGLDGRYGVWNDGLREAMRLIEKKHKVTYFDAKDDVVGFDCILFWESPCTVNGPNAHLWNKVINNPIKKYLLFSGGPIKAEWFTPFEHTFVESKINKDELDSLGIPNSTAFGVNTDIFFPPEKPWERIYDGMHHATSASWKRQTLLAEALKDKALIIGRYQPEDPFMFNESKRLGANVVFDEATPWEISLFLNKSWTLCQTASYWGGGQRATLEALSSGVPVVAMKDSPKNCEYVEESGCGLCVDPDAGHIRVAVESIKEWPEEKRLTGRAYVLSKWTAQHYADSLLKVIEA